MHRLNKVYIPYRVKCELINNVANEPDIESSNYQKPIKSKKKEIVYLPGEKLLIKLNKQAKKERQNNLQIDMDRISERMALILNEF